MATRLPAASPHAITPTNLRACLTPTDVFALFRKLGYPVEEPVALPLDDDSLPGALRDGAAARYQLATAGGARPGDPRLDVTLFVLRPTEKAGPMALARGIAQYWARHFFGDHLLVFAVPGGQTGDFQRLIIINPRRLGEDAVVRFKLHKLIVERDHPTRHDAETLNAIAMAPGMSADTLYQRQCEAFNVERLTDEFYKAYALRFREAMARIREDNKGIGAFYDDAKLHTFTQRLFGRLMFLYFLQKKGALNGEHDFIATRYLDAVKAGENFYQDALEPLFFQTLNAPRPDAASRFGRIPYLNGGLFAADEDDHQGVVYLDNALFDLNSERGLLSFLNRYNFTIEEDTPLETQVALDPEMLGKVFENLLEAEERGKSGTFYTPRPVVTFMCREALAAYLSRAVEGLSAERAGWLLDEAETGEPARDEAGHERLTYRDISFDLHERIERALQAVRVLDPAAGSGAFPLGMLALLTGVRRALYRIRENRIEPHARIVEDWKRQYIRDCLYGVDIRREAIEIARLRLWLSLVVDADPFTMEPLPNLDYKLMDGDSLIETLDGVAIYPTRPADGPAQATLMGDEERRALIERLKELQRRYFQPQPGDDRAALKRDIHTTERELLDVTYGQRYADEKTRLQGVIQQLANLRPRPEPPDLLKERDRLQRSIDATDAARRDLASGASLPFFLYRLHFASVFEERGGFDIVIANPPYVSIEHMAAAYKAQLKEAYPAVAAGRADLYVYFYARALQLLRDGGTLCFISSNKFFRANYGKGLLHLLASQSSARTVIDFGDFPVFDAAAYPCVVITDKGAPAAGHAYRGLIAGPDIVLDKIGLTLDRDGQRLPQADGVQPPSGSAATSALVKRLMALGQPLGAFTGGKMYYGIKTGLNEAFVVDQETRDRLIAEDPRSADVLKPFLRGKDVSRYHINWQGTWLIYTYHGLNIANYPAIQAHLAPYKEALAGRATKQEWYELQQPQYAYVQAFEGPKIVYPEFAPWPEFTFDTGGHYVGNKIYLLGVSDTWLVGLLNSSVAALVLASLCSSMHGSTLAHLTIYVERLPIIEPAETDKRRLEALVDQLQALGGSGPQAEALEREVDAMVYRTYGLTAEEVAEIERWHAERRALLGKGGGLTPNLLSSAEERGLAAGDSDDVGAEEQEAGQ